MSQPSPNPSQGEVPEEAVELAKKARVEAHTAWLSGPEEMITEEVTDSWELAALKAALPAIRSQIEKEWEERLGKARKEALDEYEQRVSVEAEASARLASLEGQIQEALSFADHTGGEESALETAKVAASCWEQLEHRLKEVERQREVTFAAVVVKEEERCDALERAQKAEAALSQRDEQVREALAKLEKLAIYRCPHHGLIDGRHYREQEWSPEDGCPLLTSDEECCGQVVERVDVLAALALTQQPSFTSPQQEVEVDGSALDDLFEAITPRDGSMGDLMAAGMLASHAWSEVKRLRATALTQPPADPEVGKAPCEECGQHLGLHRGDCSKHVSWADPEVARCRGCEAEVGRLHRNSCTVESRIWLVRLFDCQSTPELLGEEAKRWTIFNIDRGEGMEPWTGVRGPATNPPDDLGLIGTGWVKAAEIEVVPASVLVNLEQRIAEELQNCVALDDEDGPVEDSHYDEIARNVVAKLASTQPVSESPGNSGVER